MGLFSIRPESAAEIEPYVSYWAEDQREPYLDLKWGGGGYSPSMEGRSTVGDTSYFINVGDFALNKKLKVDQKSLYVGPIGHIAYNSGHPAFDRGVAWVSLPYDNGMDERLIGRFVDTSGGEFVALDDDRSFCIKAISTAAFEYLTAVPESAALREKVRAGEEANKQRKAEDKPRNRARMEEQHAKIEEFNRSRRAP